MMEVFLLLERNTIGFLKSKISVIKLVTKIHVRYRNSVFDYLKKNE